MTMHENNGPLLTPKINQSIDLAISNPKATVIIQGETGTGKEVVAKIIHERMGSNLPFICINCSHLQGDLALSTLFGHKRGAFTGAVELSEGAIENADGGILFLDEFHRLTSKVQEQLLRTMEDGSYCRVGETKSRRSSFRLIASVHRPLDEYVISGEMLPDLRYRLYGVEIAVPPLRERLDQMEEFVGLHLSKYGFSIEITKELATYCRKFYWCGNIRQLFGVLDGAVMQSKAEGKPLSIEHIPVHQTMLSPKTATSSQNEQIAIIHKKEVQDDLGVASIVKSYLDQLGDYKKFLAKIETIILNEVLLNTKNVDIAARALNLPRSTLDGKRKRLSLC